MDIFTKIKNITDEVRPIPFWSWNNVLNPAVLLGQIDEMAEAGFGGFIMHARTGLKTEYLGEEWFDCIGKCLTQARRRNMKAWIYDDNGWPSGFAGGLLLSNPDYLAKYLTYNIKSYFDETAYCVYDLKNGKAKRLYGNKSGINEYHCVYLNTSPANTDILNPAVTDAFIAATHKQYYDRFKDSFGNELEGFFTDEPQFYREETPYTLQIECDYVKRFGSDIKDSLVYLFLDSPHGYEFRARFYNMLSEYYCNNYYKKLYDWCQNHNCKLTGHSVDEIRLHKQMWGSGGVMPSYEYEHIPAIDSLYRECCDEIAPKQVASVAAQLNKKHILSETFGCSGYDVTPLQLKAIAESQLFQGVTTLCYHLIPYSVAGQGKIDNPPVFSSHNNWWGNMRAFNDYFSEIGALIANTEEQVDVAVLHPMQSVYLGYIRKQDYESVKELEDKFYMLLLLLRKNGISFHFIDETILKKHGRIELGKLIVGKVSYDKFIIPAVYSVKNSTKTIVDEYLSKDGKLYLFDGVPCHADGKSQKLEWCDTISFEQILADRKIKSCDFNDNLMLTSRKSELGEFLFLSNLSLTDDAMGTLPDIKGKYIALDFLTHTFNKADDAICLKPTQSLILYKKHYPDKNIKYLDKESINDLRIKNISDNYLVLDNVSISFDGVDFQEPLPIPCVTDNLIKDKYAGPLYIKYTWNQQNIPKKLTVMLEKSDYLNICVNNHQVVLTQSQFDTNFLEADISALTKCGSNELIYKIDYWQRDAVHYALFDKNATESLRNCLYYDTEIENIYIKGNFVLNDNLDIVENARQIPVTNEFYKYGYPFFYGTVSYVCAFKTDKQYAKLSLKGAFMTAQINLNGHIIDYFMCDSVDISEFMRQENRLEIKIKSSLRNLLGPHHWGESDDGKYTGPSMFTMRTSWNNNNSPYYTPEYNFANFGLIDIIIQYYEK